MEGRGAEGGGGGAGGGTGGGGGGGQGGRRWTALDHAVLPGGAYGSVNASTRQRRQRPHGRHRRWCRRTRPGPRPPSRRRAGARWRARGPNRSRSARAGGTRRRAARRHGAGPPRRSRARRPRRTARPSCPTPTRPRPSPGPRLIVANFRAFSSRLAITCSSRSGSPGPGPARSGADSVTSSPRRTTSGSSGGDPARAAGAEIDLAMTSENEWASRRARSSRSATRRSSRRGLAGDDRRGRPTSVRCRRLIASAYPRIDVSGVRRSCDTDSRNCCSNPFERSSDSAMVLMAAARSVSSSPGRPAGRAGGCRAPRPRSGGRRRPPRGPGGPAGGRRPRQPAPPISEREQAGQKEPPAAAAKPEPARRVTTVTTVRVPSCTGSATHTRSRTRPLKISPLSQQRGIDAPRPARRRAAGRRAGRRGTSAISSMPSNRSARRNEGSAAAEPGRGRPGPARSRPSLIECRQARASPLRFVARARSRGEHQRGDAHQRASVAATEATMTSTRRRVMTGRTA